MTNDEKIAAILELHSPETPVWLPAAYRDKGIQVCGYCHSLCHSYEGLRCNYPTDAIYPCDTVKLITGNGE